MESGFWLSALFVVTIVEAVTIVTWCLHRRTQVLQALRAPESGLMESKTLSSTVVGLVEPKTPSSTELGLVEPKTPSSTELGLVESKTPSSTELGLVEPKTPSSTELGLVKSKTPSSTELGLVESTTLTTTEFGLMESKTLPPTEVEFAEQKALSPTEVAFILSRGDCVSTLGVLILDATQNPDHCYMSEPEKELAFRELIAKEPSEYVGKRARETLSLSLTFDMMNAAYGKRVRHFIATNVLSSSKSSLAFRRVATQTQNLFYEGGSVFRDFCDHVLGDLRARGLIASGARVKVAHKQMDRLHFVPVIQTGAVVIATTLVGTVLYFVTSLLLDGRNWSEIFGVIPVCVVELIVICLWVSVCGIPAALLKYIWEIKLLAKWAPVRWAVTEMPKSGPRQFLALVVPTLFFAMRPLALFVTLWLIWVVTGGLSNPGILGATLAAIYGWLVHYKTTDDRKMLATGLVPTLLCLQELKVIEDRVAHNSPTAVLGNSLNSESYDPGFSEVVAVYGLEVLWLLESEDLDL